MTEIDYNQYYPGGCFKQLSDAAGGSGISYSQYAPGGPANQLRVHINPALALNQHHPGGVWAQAEMEVEGGGTPDWVPADAVIHIDFVGGDPQGRAWVEGTGETAIETLLGSDPILDGAYATTLYFSDDLTVDGYKPSGPTDEFTAFLGAANAKITAGATVRYVTKQPVTQPSATMALAMVSEDGNDALEFTVTYQSLQVETWNGSANAGALNVCNRQPNDPNVFAYTVTATRFEAAANGNATLLVTALDETDRPPDNPLIGLAFNFRGNTATIRSITFYDPLPDTTGLSSLSEDA